MTPPLPRRALLAGAALLGLPAPHAGAIPAPFAGAMPARGALARILENGELRVGLMLRSPPWAAYNEFGEPDGSEVALVRQLARDLGARLRIVVLEAGERIPALESGRVDIIASFPVDTGLLRRIALARPHGRLRVVIAGRAGRHLHGFADLDGLTLALPMGTPIADLVHPLLPPGAVAIFLPDYAECLDAVLYGEVDATAAFEWSVRNLLLTDPFAAIEQGFLVRDSPLSLGVAMGERDLLRFLDTFVLLRTADGTLDALYRRYFVSAPAEAPTAERRAP